MSQTLLVHRRACRRIVPNGKHSLSISFVLELHVLLQVSHDSFENGCTRQRSITVNQLISSEQGQRIWKSGHYVYCFEVEYHILWIVRLGCSQTVDRV